MLTLLGTEARATVEANQYRQFWLWAGVRPQPVLQQADRLYLHQGEIGPLDPALPDQDDFTSGDRIGRSVSVSAAGDRIAAGSDIARKVYLYEKNGTWSSPTAAPGPNCAPRPR